MSNCNCSSKTCVQKDDLETFSIQPEKNLLIKYKIPLIGLSFVLLILFAIFLIKKFTKK